MAKKISLREFQQNVTARLMSAAETAPASSKLGFLVGTQSWLVNLADVSEVLPVPPLADVPLTRPWFNGVANIRGNLFTAVDFSAFLGDEATPMNLDTRLLLGHAKFSVNAGLLVSRMLGLKNPDQLEAQPVSNPHPWVAGEFVDPAGTVWKELDMRGLLRHPQFLQVGM